jgi:hypothetical protein
MTYQGTVTPGEMNWTVTVDGEPLDPRNDLVNHSPDGLSWGYAGSGPAQLGLAILADFYRKSGYAPVDADERAVHFHQDLKAAWVAGLDMESGWTIEQGDLAAIVLLMEKRSLRQVLSKIQRGT